MCLFFQWRARQLCLRLLNLERIPPFRLPHFSLRC